MPRLRILSSLPERSVATQAKHTAMRQELSNIESAAANIQFVDVMCGTLDKISLPVPVGDRSCRNWCGSRMSSKRSSRQGPEPYSLASSFVGRLASEPNERSSWQFDKSDQTKRSMNIPIPSIFSDRSVRTRNRPSSRMATEDSKCSTRAKSLGASGSYARKAPAGVGVQNPADEHSICSSCQKIDSMLVSNVENSADDQSSCSVTTSMLPSKRLAETISPAQPNRAWGPGIRMQSDGQRIHTGELADILRRQDVPVASTPAGPSLNHFAEAAESPPREMVQEAAQTLPSVTPSASAIMTGQYVQRVAEAPRSPTREVLEEAAQLLPSAPPSANVVMAKLLMSSGETLRRRNASVPASSQAQLRRMRARRLTSKIQTVTEEIGQSMPKETSESEEIMLEDVGVVGQVATEEAYWRELWELSKQQRLQLVDEDCSACLTFPAEPQSHPDQPIYRLLGS